MNYQETFITVAPDCPVEASVMPKQRGQKKSVPLLQYELLSGNPYTYTGQELIFETHVRRLNLSEVELANQRDEIWAELFSKPHACMRASALAKKYGWGLHYDEDGRIALVGMETDTYQQMNDNPQLKKLAAMRSKRA